MSKRVAIEVQGVTHGAAPIPMGVKVGNMVFSSAIMGKDPATDSLPLEPELQMSFAFQNLRSLLEEAGGSTDHIGHVTVFLKDNEYRGLLNEEWLKMFPNEKDRPARHVNLTDLQAGMIVQLEIIAVVS